ncbi:MAG TPA: SsrA-binding protein SmpB [Candidatus Limnocylindria bacterium]|jgi:SsrA-binding protein|nr:SsrA-binding protein SmpB [Candidatus Limnocylindria bacterium]
MPARKIEAPAAEERSTLLADNRKARFDYQIERRLEAGIALRGTEIKSLRAGHANLRDGYARVENGEVWLRNVHIAPWANSAYANHDPLRPRKLLLHKDEIGQLVGTIAQKGYTLVPLRIYTRSGRAKVELGIARGRKRYDKRQVIKEREAAREMDVAIRRRLGRG